MRLCLLLLLATAAHAEPRTRDGFQLALGAGGAFHHVTGTPETGPEATLTGFGIAGLLLAGYTVSPGFTVGGGAMGGHIFQPDVKIGDLEGESDTDLIFLVVGPYLDWAPNPAGPFHLILQAGFATMEDGEKDTDTIATGFGVGLGAGYEVWVADDWAIGGFARVQFLRTTTEFDLPGGRLEVIYNSVVPALQAIAVWH